MLAVLAAPTAWLWNVQADQRVDLAEAGAGYAGHDVELARRLAAFEEDVVVLVGYVPREPGRGFSPEQQRALRGMRTRLAAIAGVAGVYPVPAGSRLRLLAVRLDDSRPRDATAAEVRARARSSTPDGLEVLITGEPIGRLEIEEEVEAEQDMMLPLIAGVLVALLLLSFRSVTLAAAVLLPAGAGIVWTSGFFALSGHPLDPIAVLLQPVILTVGVAGGVHLVEGYLSRRAGGAARADAVSGTLRDLALPAALTAATTAAGFFMLTLNELEIVGRFGRFAALGVVLTAFLSFTITPALLILLGPRGSLDAVRRRQALAQAVGQRLTTWIRRARVPITVIGLLLALAGAWEWSRASVDNDPIRVLPADNPLRRDTERLVELLGGIETFDVFVPHEDLARRPDLETELLERIPRLAGVVRLARPPQRAPSGDVLLSWVIERGGSAERERLFDAVERLAAELGAPGVRAVGSAVAEAREAGMLVRGQVVSMSLTLVVLWLLMWVVFRSLRLGLLGMIPNALPCLLVYGALAVFGRPLTVATTMIGSVLLGLIVDDTIHFLYRYRGARRAGRNRRAAIVAAYVHAGRPIVITTLVLALGFGAGVLGRLSSTVEFSALMAATVTTALITNFVLLPALLLLRDAAERSTPPAPRLAAERTVSGS